MTRKLVDLDDLIHISTAAELRGVKRQSIYYQVANGNLQIVVIDGTMFVKRSQVNLLKLRATNNSLEDRDGNANDQS